MLVILSPHSNDRIEYLYITFNIPVVEEKSRFLILCKRQKMYHVDDQEYGQ